MSKKRVLITGAAGFLGSHLCDYFMSKEYEVLAMDNRRILKVKFSINESERETKA